jgi:hypothetical protein
MNQSPDQQATVEVFSGTSWEVGMVRSLLEAAEISNFTINSLISQPLYEPIQSECVKIMVLEGDKQEAQKIVTDYFKNLKK